MNKVQDTTDERLARVKLSCAIEPGDPRVNGLADELGAVKVLGYLEAAGEIVPHWGYSIGQQLAHVDPERVLAKAAARSIRFLTPADAEWPHQLDELRTARALNERGGIPLGLWVRGEGDLRELTAAAVAVAGSRAATSYGVEQAQMLSGDPAARGRTVVGGLAFGVDQAAHRGALGAGGPTIAVMPCGVDRPYPAAHAQLLEAIARRGLVVSEAPPGAAPTRLRFLARNRLVAGLSEGTVVVEGAVRSGALNSAQWTTNLHRPVLGVPGPVTSAASMGVNQLIRHGRATAVISAEEIVSDIAAHAAERGSPATSTSPGRTARLRVPYVGEGVDGCRRSAQIDREEADGLDLRDPRRVELLASAESWEQRAALLAHNVEGIRRPETERQGALGASSTPGQGLGR